jgi:hypothetical protein
MQDQTKSTGQFKCDECGKVLNSQAELQEHRNRHKDQSPQGTGSGFERKS